MHMKETLRELVTIYIWQKLKQYLYEERNFEKIVTNVLKTYKL